VLGIGGCAGHAHKFLPPGDGGYLSRAALPHTVAAVSAACLLTPRAVYTQVSGLDPDFAVAFNDVDYCLRLAAAGRRSVWTPDAVLEHQESASRGSDLDGPARARFTADCARLRARWGAALDADPFYNPNLTLEREDLSLAWPPRDRALRVT
jgi:GT2 family glycosyltransferase